MHTFVLLLPATYLEPSVELSAVVLPLTEPDLVSKLETGPLQENFRKLSATVEAALAARASIEGSLVLLALLHVAAGFGTLFDTGYGH